MIEAVHVIGAGGHGKIIVDALQQGLHSLGHIFDLAPENKKILGLPIYSLPPPSWGEHEDIFAIIAVGDNRTRQAMSQYYRAVHWENAIHPSALIHPTASLGKGIYVGAGAIIQPDVRIGNHCIINTGAIIEHDSLVQDYVHIAPHVTLTGAVEIGEGCLIGAGTTVIPQQRIGPWSLIGAGSTVVHAIPAYSKAWGTPCQVHGRLDPASP